MLVALVRELDRGGLADNVACVVNPEGAHPGLLAELQEHAAPVGVLSRRRLFDGRIALAIAELARDTGAHVLHAHPGVVNAHARAAAALLGIPHVATLHTMPGPLNVDSPWRVRLDRWTARLSSAIVAPCRAIAEAYATRLLVPWRLLRVIPNPALAEPPDPRAARALRAELAADGARIVACVARLAPVKGVDDLVRAIAVLRARGEDVRLVVAGGGPEEPRLRELADAHGLNGSVRLLGPRSDVGEVLAAADVFCLPSHHEGLPISLLEAMAAGRPCVATAVGGVPETLGDAGLVVPPRRPAALADALGRVLDDALLARRLARRARAAALGHTPQATAAAYADLYEELTAGGGRA